MLFKGLQKQNIAFKFQTIALIEPGQNVKIIQAGSLTDLNGLPGQYTFLTG